TIERSLIFDNNIVTYSGNYKVLLNGTNRGNVIKGGNVTISNLQINGPGGEWSLIDSLIIKDPSIGNSFTLTKGTFRTNNHNIRRSGSFAQMYIYGDSLFLGASVLDLESGSSNYGEFIISGNQNLYFDAGTSHIMARTIT